MSVPVSIVIPVLNGRELLEKLLESIARQTVAPLEIMVVDNGSSDGAPESACRAGAQVIAMGRNAGFAAAVNRGIREAKGEFIALLNSDVELSREWLEVIWQGARDHGADFATGTILQSGNDATLDGTYDLICRGGCPWRAGHGQSTAQLSGAPLEIQFSSATAALYRSDLFERVGLFEESFESYLEDIDFSLRCASAGRKGVYLPSAICWHLGSATFGRWSPRTVRLMARNQLLLIARLYPAELIRRWLWPMLVAHLLWGALALRHGRMIAWLRGKFEGLARFASARRSSRCQDPAFASLIAASEREIHRLQSANGFDTYWRLYFRLVRLPK